MTPAAQPGTSQTLVPAPSVLSDVLPTPRLNPRGVPSRELRNELRRISDLRSGLTVIGALSQSFGVVATAAFLNTWWAYLAAFVFMARGHVCLNILGHEAAHRLLFTSKKLNDFVGRWLLGYPTLQAMLTYRRAHFAHHRDELGPDEPDLSLYSGYPITPASWRRKLMRDASGISAYKNFRVLFFALRKGKREAWQVLAVQAAMLGVSIAVGRPLAYLVWILSWSSLWQVSNRLRSIAEHGGMVRSKDRRLTTHVIHQSRLARFWMVPYNTGWHLAHHVDMGVPWRNLPRLHAELVSAGWVTSELTYPSYRAFWRRASSGNPKDNADKISGRLLGAERPALREDDPRTRLHLPLAGLGVATLRQ